MIRRGQRGLEEGGLLLEADRDQRGHERALAGEVLVDHGSTDPETIGQLTHRERVQALLLQELTGYYHDLPSSGTEPVHSGAGRRWPGTANGGIYLARGISRPGGVSPRGRTAGLAWSN